MLSDKYWGTIEAVSNKVFQVFNSVIILTSLEEQEMVRVWFRRIMIIKISLKKEDIFDMF